MIAFANAHRDQDAYLLIGVKDQGMGKDRVVDISSLNLDDAKFRDIIRAYTSLPVEYEFSTAEVFGKRIGVFKMPPSNKRFHFVARDYMLEQKKLLLEGQGWIREGAQNRSLNGHDSQQLKEQTLKKIGVRLEIKFDDESEIHHSTKPDYLVKEMRDGSDLGLSILVQRIRPEVYIDTRREHIFAPYTIKICFRIINTSGYVAEHFRAVLHSTSSFYFGEDINSKNYELFFYNASLHSSNSLSSDGVCITFPNGVGEYKIKWEAFSDNMPQKCEGELTLVVTDDAN
jgi:hypothetical protein